LPPQASPDENQPLDVKAANVNQDYITKQNTLEVIIDGLKFDKDDQSIPDTPAGTILNSKEIDFDKELLDNQ